MKPIIILMALAIVVPELLTGSTPLSGFFNPVTLLILFFGYGLAVLLIREISVRFNLNYFGIFLLGFAYSFLNEGIIAKTLLLRDGIPIDAYDNYGVIGGISVPWALGIGLFHAVCSVIFPIVAAHILFPERSEEPWLTKKEAWLIGILTLLLTSLLFLGEWRVQGTPGYLFSFWLIIGLISLVALRFKRKGSEIARADWKVFGLGLSTFFFSFIILTAMASTKVPIPVFFVVFVTGTWFYLRTLKNIFGISKESLLTFILGIYFYIALQAGIFGAMLGATERILVGLLMAVVILFAVRRLIRRVI